MAKSKLDRAVGIVLTICIIVLIYFGICGLIFFRKKNLSLGTLTQSDYLNAYMRLSKECVNDEMDNEYYKKFVEKDLGISFYIYTEKKMKKYCGMALPTIRMIVLDERLHGNEYCVTLVHELIHIKKFIQQERYVCYETFKYLYESEELHNVGVWYGLKQLNGDYSGEYDISGLVVNYLTNK